MCFFVSVQITHLLMDSSRTCDLIAPGVSLVLFSLSFLQPWSQEIKGGIQIVTDTLRVLYTFNCSDQVIECSLCIFSLQKSDQHFANKKGLFLCIFQHNCDDIIGMFLCLSSNHTLLYLQLFLINSLTAHSIFSLL